jgi:hypothetical protein
MEKVHTLYFIGLIIIGIISTYVLIILPRGISIPALQTTFFLFGLALNTIVLLWWIAGFLLYRWFKTGKRNPSLIIWSISFFLYSITFVAHLFRALGYSIANENLSVFHFFIYRWGMIVWAAGILYGLLKILTENKTHQLIPSVIILILGFTWLILGLFIIPSENPIEFTMYLFLHTIWIPVCFTMFYIFAYYGYKTKQNGPKLVALGFFGVMISYYGWAPWHFSDLIYIYFIWYFIFLLSLTPILIGFIVMAVEEK